MDPRLAFERVRYLAFREKLLADDPAIDETTLADTLEGITDYMDTLAATIRAALKDEREAMALRLEMDDNAARLKRFQDRAASRREAVRAEMETADIKKITTPAFTVSLRRESPSVIVTDETKIPAEYFEFRAHLKKRELGNDMKAGIMVAGAELTNPGYGLTVRTR